METINSQGNITEIIFLDPRTLGRDLLKAARDDDLETVRSVLDTFPYIVHAYNNSDGGLSAVHYAAEEGNLEVLVALIDDYGAHVDAQTIHGETPLIYAAINGDVNMIDALLARNANLELRMDGGTPLHLAVASRRRHAAERLLRGGADVEARNADGVRPLHLAARLGEMGMVKMLLDQFGAQLNAKDNDRHTPLMFAALEGKTSVALELMQRDPQLSNYVFPGMGEESYLAAISQACIREHVSTGQIMSYVELNNEREE